MFFCGRVVFVLLIILAAVFSNLGSADEKQDEYDYLPVTKAGQKWRIGYYQGGPSGNYYPYLVATVKGLMDLGWIEVMDLPGGKSEDTQSLWNILAQHIDSDYIEFIPDGYYTANWDSETRKVLRSTILDRLNKQKDIDLMIAMGTWAGKDLATNEHHVPTMVISSTDPLRAGIIASNEDSGFDHVHARVDPRRHERQIRIFHNIIGFRKLGVAYEDTVLGRSYAAIDLLEKVAAEKGFEIVRCFTEDDIPDRKIAGDSVIKCFEELAPQVDAAYVVVQSGVNADTIPTLVAITNKHRVPTFSQQGSDEVRYGFLLSIAREGGFAPVGRFLAVTMAKILNGAKPRQLKQVFEEGPDIAINLKTAEMIGLYLHADVLAAADEIYREIETP